MQEAERPSRPVLFLTKESQYPYWGRGSSLFVASDRNIYWLTARHVLDRQGASAPNLMITPTDETAITVPFKDLFQIETEPNNPDFKDLYMLRLNMEEFWDTADSELYAWNIDRNFYDCRKLEHGDELFVLGFPSESRFVDYDVKRIHFTQVVLRGVYAGLALESHCHTLKIETSIELKDFDGVSGGTVFRHPRSPQEPSAFVGLAIRGSVESGLIHFVDCAVIAEFVRLSDAA